MRKITSILMLLTLCVGASWAEDTETIQLSTSVDNPEHVYHMKNGNLRWMTRTSGPTANATAYNAAEFAFFDGSEKKVGTGSESAYKILCVSTGKWLSYTKAGGYDNKIGFAFFVDNQADAEAWGGDIADGKGDLGNVYQFRPYNSTGIAGKYMNWFQGANSNPNDNTTITVGLWQDNATMDNGSCWFVNAVTMDDVKTAYNSWKVNMDTMLGSEFNQYSVDTEALNTAETALSNATTWQAICTAINQCKDAYTANIEGKYKYIRIQNTLRGTYTSLDGYTLNMKNKTYDDVSCANDPTFIWKCEKIGDKLYLKNVYAGLYPQYVNGGGDATTQIGTSMNYEFTYAKHAEASGENPAQWNIFFGGRQVNVEENGNVNQWFEAAAHHYIYAVESVPTDNFAEMCTNYYEHNEKANEDVSGVKKIKVDENATEIISPNEFASPLVINNIIDTYKDKLNMTGEVTKEKIRDMFEALANWLTVRTYQDAITRHGSLLSYAYTPQVEYGTIILPINWAKPAGWTINSCSAKDAATNVLTLVPVASGVKNKPYIVQFAEDKIGTTCQLIGYSNDAATTNQTEGWLTGVLAEGDTYVPAGSYILSKDKNDPNSKLGFYKVVDDNVYKASVNRCYLTIPATDPASRFEALFFEDGTETGINSVPEVQTKQGGIYNIAGQRLSKLQKGLNIVNGKKIIVK